MVIDIPLFIVKLFLVHLWIFFFIFMLHSMMNLQQFDITRSAVLKKWVQLHILSAVRRVLLRSRCSSYIILSIKYFIILVFVMMTTCILLYWTFLDWRHHLRCVFFFILLNILSLEYVILLINIMLINIVERSELFLMLVLLWILRYLMFMLYIGFFVVLGFLLMRRNRRVDWRSVLCSSHQSLGILLLWW